MKLHPDFFHRALQFLAHGTVHGGDNGVLVFDDVHFSSKPGVDRAQLQTDHTAANDGKRFGQRRKLEGFGGSDDAFTVQRDKGQAGGLRSCRNQDAVCGNAARFSLPWGHFDRVGIDHGTHALQHSNAVFVHEVVYPGDGLVHDLLLSGDHAWKVYFQATDFDAVGLKLLVGFEIMLRTVEQCFRGNAPHIQAGSAEGPALFDEGGLKTELCGADGGHIPAGSGADDHEVVLVHGCERLWVRR